jgi:hypothetical protein
MKRFVSIAIGTFIAVALPGAGWAQQQDLEVTISVVPADAAADAATKVIELPASASDQGRESSAFGLGIANKAREMRGELGREFGQAVSDAASQHGQEQSAAGRSRRP